jgi:FtsH-binding integral membrane protein
LPLVAATVASVYALFAAAMGFTVVGVFLGALYAPVILSSGVHFLLLLAELAIIFTSGWWVKRHPWNFVLFGAFPLLSGFTIAPFLLLVAATPTGNAILLQALASTALMVLATALIARSYPKALSGMGGVLVTSVIGLLVLMLLQLFVPALRLSTGFELFISGAGVLLFAAFTVYDLARLRQMAVAGTSPFILALSLYLDIFNLFLMILRFMLALSGGRK